MFDHLNPEEILACRDGETEEPQVERHLTRCPKCRERLREAEDFAAMLRRFAAAEKRLIPETPAPLVAMARDIMTRPQPGRLLGTVSGKILGEGWLELAFDPVIAGAVRADVCFHMAAFEANSFVEPLRIDAGSYHLVMRGKPAPGGAVLEIEATDSKMAPAAGLRFSLRSPGRASVSVETGAEGHAEVAVLAGESKLIVHADFPGEITLRIG